MPGVQLRPMSRMALVMTFIILSIVDTVNAFAALGCAGTLQRSSTAGVFLGRRAGLADAVSLRGRGGGNSGVAPSMAATDVGAEPPMLIGHGFDIHRLTAGKDLVIGGVKIPYELGADAHSDGDVIYHSVVDAILGALGLPDIGQLFPDNDPQWSGADSSVFMEEAYRRMDSRGFRVGNVDVTLILQKPKVMDIKPRMRENIVRLLHTSAGRVNVKARTHEKVDAVGEGRAMACHVVVLLEKIP